MPWTSPTLSEINQRIKSDVQSRLGLQPILQNSVLAIIAAALAGAVHLLYGYIAWAFKQMFVQSSELEYLRLHGSLVGITQAEATFASGNVSFTGVDGSSIPLGTTLRRSDGAIFTTQAAATISGGGAIVEVEASAVGASGNTDPSIVLSLLSPIVGVSSSVTVGASGITGGVEKETQEAYRARIEKRYQDPPQGGSKSDYEQWALSVAGVTRAWVYPLALGDGTVTVAIVADNEAGGPIPSAGLVSDTQDYIDSVRPVTAEVTVFAPTALNQDFDIQLSPNTAEVQQAVTAELVDLFRRIGEPGGTIPISKIREAVSIAAGESDNVVVSPTANVVAGTGELPIVDDITYGPITP